jgi:hypothetical protein
LAPAAGLVVPLHWHGDAVFADWGGLMAHRGISVAEVDSGNLLPAPMLNDVHDDEGELFPGGERRAAIQEKLGDADQVLLGGDGDNIQIGDQGRDQLIGGMGGRADDQISAAAQEA